MFPVCLFIILSEVIFPHLVVILTALETAKNILAFSSQIFGLFGIPPKNSQLNQAARKKYLPHFPSKKNRKRKFQTHHNPLIIPVWLEIPSTPLRSAVFIFFWYKIQLFGCYCAKLSQTGKSALGTRLLSQRDFTSFDVPIVWQIMRQYYYY